MPALASLSNAQLEDLYNQSNLECDGDLGEAVALEMMGRPDACPQSYDLMWEMQDLGWGGGVSQDDRDAR
jgi:hypothetical protein